MKQPAEKSVPGGIPIKKVMKDICEITGVGMNRMKESIRGPGGNPERRFALWALQRSTYPTYREIGEQLDMTVQHVARDVRRNRGGIQKFTEWTEAWLERYPASVYCLALTPVFSLLASERTR